MGFRVFGELGLGFRVYRVLGFRVFKGCSKTDCLP